MASTADIQVKASRGRTTHELHKDALEEEREICVFVCVWREDKQDKVWRAEWNLHGDLFPPER